MNEPDRDQAVEWRQPRFACPHETVARVTSGVGEVLYWWCTECGVIPEQEVPGNEEPSEVDA